MVYLGIEGELVSDVKIQVECCALPIRTSGLPTLSCCGPLGPHISTRLIRRDGNQVAPDQARYSWRAMIGEAPLGCL